MSDGGGRLRESSGKMQAVDLNMVSTTIVHDQFFLEDEAGRERAFQLQDFNVACREGNSLTVVATFAPKQARGPYVAVRNNTTQQFINEKALRPLYSLGMLRHLLIMFGHDDT